MKIKQLYVQNYGWFEDLTVDFALNGERSGNVTVIVRNNGAGKSQVLQALAIGVSGFVHGIWNEIKGFKIDKALIENSKSHC